MRRKDREITDLNRIAQIVHKCQAMSLAFAGDTPYVIPMNYGFTYDGGEFKLYIHGATKGEKIDRINADPRVAFTMFTNNAVYGEGEAHNYTSSFDSVCGEGVVRFLEGEDKKRGLAAVMAHYAPGREFAFDERMLKVTMVAEIEVTSIFGKHHD